MLADTEPLSVIDVLLGEQRDVLLLCKLYQGQFLYGPSPNLDDYLEANFLGYEAQEFIPHNPPTGSGHKVCSAGSTMMEFAFAVEDGVVNDIGGAYLVAVFSDGSERFISATEFDKPIHIDGDALPFGLVLFVNVFGNFISPLI